MEPTKSVKRKPGRSRDVSPAIDLQLRITHGQLGTPASLDRILEEAAGVAGADGAMLEIRGGDGAWSRRGTSGCLRSFANARGVAKPGLGVNIGTETTLCNDTLADASVDRTACAGIGARSIALVPIPSHPIAGDLIAGDPAFVVTFVSGEPDAFGSSHPDLLRLLAGLAMSAALAAERPAKTEEQLAGEIATLTAAVRRENEFVKLLQEIAVAANEAANVEEAIRRSLERICETTGWPMGHLYLANEEGDRLTSTPIWHVSHPVRFNALRRLTDGMDWRRNVGLPGRVLAEGKPSWVVDLRADPSIVRTRLASSLGVRSSFALPLLIGSDVVAVLEFFSEHALDPDERLLEIARHIGVQLGRVIERKRASLLLAASERHYRLLFERNLAGVFRIATDGRIQDCNDALAHMLGYASRAELRSQSLFERIDEGDRETHFERLNRERTLTNAEMRMTRTDGSRIWALVNASLLELGEATVVEGTLLDVTARKHEELQVEFRASHDALTKLPNRAFFRTQLDKAVSLAQRSGSALALVFIDLDGFKPVNDTLGHAAGDWLLQQTATRLVQCVRGSDLVARLGGDEFTVLLTNLTHAHDAETVAKKLLSRIGAPLSYEGQELNIGASIGIAIFPDDAAEAEPLIAAADEAMYDAKKGGGNAFRFRGER